MPFVNGPVPGKVALAGSTNTPATTQIVGTEYSDFYQRVAKGEVEDDDAFAFICRVDKTDRETVFDNEACWIKALPALAADGGTVLLFAGLPAGARVAVDAHAVHYREVSIVGSFHYTPREADEALALLSGGAIPAAEIVSVRRPLTDWQAAFDLAREGAVLKVAVIP